MGLTAFILPQFVNYRLLITVVIFNDGQTNEWADFAAGGGGEGVGRE